jgi:hypothetical protein
MLSDSQQDYISLMCLQQKLNVFMCKVEHYHRPVAPDIKLESHVQVCSCCRNLQIAVISVTVGVFR